jgi:hypothetical protein
MFREVSFVMCSLLDVTVVCISLHNKINLTIMIMYKFPVLLHPGNAKIGGLCGILREF